MKDLATTDAQKERLSQLINNMGYEVIPFKNAVADTVKYIPLDMPISVTATQDRGVETTIEAAIHLANKGYQVTPHVPARIVVNQSKIKDITKRLKEKNIKKIFIVAGDAKQAEGEFTKALDLIKAIEEQGHHFEEIGVSGYPEGHALFSDDIIDQSLIDKVPYAQRVFTQICFDANTIIDWAKGIKADGVDMPIQIGLPGPVQRRKLMRIAANIGLGQSANFLKKQQSMVWRFFTPTGYNPTELIKDLIRNDAIEDTNISGLHINTFNDLESTEKWRQNLIDQINMN